MFLKSIEIFGFKSFADKSCIDFDEGLSTIIGPNGCGKSNVIEAIRWVLGEQRTKGIRIDKMSNVIFNGTEHRHPLNVAEVTLVFSNEQNILPLEFSEISIKRRIFRNSNSEYYINNKQVGYKELQSLLADTGLGVTEYLVMEQGRIDQILTSKPEEKRAILEEAAGIKQYRDNSKEGTRKREKVQENIIQIEQIKKEVEHQYNTLARQKDKALKYRQLRESLSDYEIMIACKNYRTIQDKLVKARSILENHISTLQQKEESYSVLQEQSQEFNEGIKTKEQAELDHHKRFSHIQARKNALNQILQTNFNMINNIKEQQSMYSTQLELSNTKKNEYVTEKESIVQNKKSYKEKISLLKLSIKNTKQKISTNKKDILSAQNTLASLEKQDLHIQGALEEYHKELRKVVDRLAEELDKNITQSGYSVAHQNKRETDMTDIITHLQHTVQELQNHLTDAKITSDTVPITSIVVHTKNLSKISKDIKTRFLAYRDIVPLFLNEFLENDGVLSHKHIIDKKILELTHKQELCRKEKQAQDEQINLLRQENQTLQDSFNDFYIQLNSYTQQLEILDKEEEKSKQSIKEVNHEITQYKTHLKQISNTLKKEQKDYENHQNQIASLDQEEKSIDKEIKQLRKTIEKHYTEVGTFQNKLQTSIKNINSINMKIQNAREHVTTLETKIDMITENFREQQGEMINIYITNKQYMKKLNTPIDKIKAQIASTTQSIASLGAVNLLAEDEFLQVEERYNHLISQLNDLYEADKNLEEVIVTIEKKSREQLETTFKKVNKSFKQLFEHIMGGGVADLLLVNDDDILKAGIEVIAQPPEKKTKYLVQLSGGERTLIALAFLFSLHTVRPAPFCLLDELDAALDDVNIDKFLELLYNYKDNTQFVVVSHNKRTIAQAKNIIGVSMEERGVSKFIGVKVDEHA